MILNLDHFHIHQQLLKLNKENMNVVHHHNLLLPIQEKKINFLNEKKSIFQTNKINDWLKK